MEYIFLLIIVLGLGITFYKMIRNKKTPSSNYIPYDDITKGAEDQTRNHSSISDSKHSIEYQEERKSD